MSSKEMTPEEVNEMLRRTYEETMAELDKRAAEVEKEREEK